MNSKKEISSCIIISKDAEPEALEELQKRDNIVLFSSDNITYKQISNHPDIFLTPFSDYLLLANNFPDNIISELKHLNIDYRFSNTKVGLKFPHTVPFNAALHNDILISHPNYCAKEIYDHFESRKQFHVNQAYTRCNTIVLDENCIITSDKQTYTQLKTHFKVLLFQPKDIQLKGFDYGFIGGCMGVSEREVFYHGNPLFHEGGNELLAFVEENGFRNIILSNNKLSDIGSIFFISQPK